MAAMPNKYSAGKKPFMASVRTNPSPGVRLPCKDTQVHLSVEGNVITVWVLDGAHWQCKSVRVPKGTRKNISVFLFTISVWWKGDDVCAAVVEHDIPRPLCGPSYAECSHCGASNSCENMYSVRHHQEGYCKPSVVRYMSFTVPPPASCGGSCITWRDYMCSKCAEEHKKRYGENKMW